MQVKFSFGIIYNLPLNQASFCFQKELLQTFWSCDNPISNRKLCDNLHDVMLQTDPVGRDSWRTSPSSGEEKGDKVKIEKGTIFT